MSQMMETGKAWLPGPIVTLSNVIDSATSINIRLGAVTGSLA
jgi:hypothetical protein